MWIWGSPVRAGEAVPFDLGAPFNPEFIPTLVHSSRRRGQKTRPAAVGGQGANRVVSHRCSRAVHTKHRWRPARTLAALPVLPIGEDSLGSYDGETSALRTAFQMAGRRSQAAVQGSSVKPRYVGQPRCRRRTPEAEDLLMSADWDISTTPPRRPLGRGSQTGEVCFLCTSTVEPLTRDANDHTGKRPFSERGRPKPADPNVGLKRLHRSRARLVDASPSPLHPANPLHSNRAGADPGCALCRADSGSGRRRRRRYGRAAS